MAKNECSSTGEGRHQTVALADCVNVAVSSGHMVVVGSDGLHGVAMKDAVAGRCTIDIAGKWYLPVESGATIAVGDAVYCHVVNQTIDNDPAHGWFFGYAMAEITTATTGDTICVLVCQLPIAKYTPGTGGGIFISTEQTGTGSAQNIAHGLGVVPSRVFVAPTDLAPATVGQYTVTEGTHTAANVVVTVTADKKYKVLALA